MRLERRHLDMLAVHPMANALNTSELIRRVIEEWRAMQKPAATPPEQP